MNNLPNTTGDQEVDMDQLAINGILPFHAIVEAYEPGIGWRGKATGSTVSYLRDVAEDEFSWYQRVRIVAQPSGRVLETLAR